MMTEIFLARDLKKEPIRLEELRKCADFISTYLPKTSQIKWPLLSERFQCSVFVKHENHLPTGSFKVRGGIWAIGQLKDKKTFGNIIAATRGNHGQSVAFAASKFDKKAIVVVPYGNNEDKNQAMKAMGAELIEYGDDFDTALAYAQELSRKKNFEFVPSFHPMLVVGVATYGYEFMTSVKGLDVVYIPIGLGSGIAGFIAAKEALGIDVDVVGVVAERADAYASSWESEKVRTTEHANTIADGLAVRAPSEAALKFLIGKVNRIIRVSERQIMEAVKIILSDCHNLVEPAGAASLAGLIKEQEEVVGKRVGIVLTGSNIEQKTLIKILSFKEI